MFGSLSLKANTLLNLVATGLDAAHRNTSKNVFFFFKSLVLDRCLENSKSKCALIQ